MRFHDDFYEVFVFYVKNLRRICHSCLNGLSASASWYIRTCSSETGTRSFLYDNIRRPRGCSPSGVYSENELVFCSSTREINNSVVHFPTYLWGLQKLVNFELVPFNLGLGFKEAASRVLTNSDQEYKNFPSFSLSAEPKIVKVVPDRAGCNDCYIFLIPANAKIIFSDPADYSSFLSKGSVGASFQKVFERPLEVYLHSAIYVFSYYMKTQDDLYTQEGLSYYFDFCDNFDAFDPRVKKFRKLNPNVGACSVCYFEKNIPVQRYTSYPYISTFSEADFYSSFIDSFTSYFKFLQYIFSSVFRSPKYVLRSIDAALKDMEAFRYN